MSRALNIDASKDHVIAACAKHDATISAIETLPSGCTRVVLCSADGAAIIQRSYGNKVITAPRARTKLSLASRGVPLTEVAPPKSAAAGTPFTRKY
jgi:hypothetical protein